MGLQEWSFVKRGTAGAAAAAAQEQTVSAAQRGGLTWNTKTLKKSALKTNISIPQPHKYWKDLYFSWLGSRLWRRGSGYVRAHILGQLEALDQCLWVEGRRLWPECRECELMRVLSRRLDYSVQTPQNTVHTQLRTSCQRCYQSTDPAQRGAARLTDDRAQTVAQTSTQSVWGWLAKGGGALLRRRGALEGKGRAAAGWTPRVELLEWRRVHWLTYSTSTF